MKKDYALNDIIECYVTGITKYGVFVNVDNWFDGLIHISEISEGFVKNINDYVKIGEKIYCQIIGIDELNHQLKLSIKDINYKSEISDSLIKETRKGFWPLKENLPSWINEKLEEYK